MSKWLLALVLFFTTGCTTPDVVFEDLKLVRDNLVIQKQVTDHLMKNIVPQNDRQVRAVAEMKLRVEQRFDRMATATNRLIIYFEADRKVEFITNVFDIMLDSEFEGFLSKKEVSNEEISVATNNGRVTYSEYDSWMLSSSKSD